MHDNRYICYLMRLSCIKNHEDRMTIWTWSRLLERTVVIWPGDRFYFAPCLN